MEAEPAQVLSFDSFEVNLRSGELRKNGQKVKLPQQSFRILAMLLERPGEVVLRPDIRQRLWPNDISKESEGDHFCGPQLTDGSPAHYSSSLSSACFSLAMPNTYHDGLSCPLRPQSSSGPSEERGRL